MIRCAYSNPLGNEGGTILANMASELQKRGAPGRIRTSFSDSMNLQAAAL